MLRGQLWGLKDTVRGGELCQVDIGIGMMMVPHGDSSEVEYGLKMDGKKRIQYGYFKGLRDQRWKESRGWKEGDLHRKVLSMEVQQQHLQDYEPYR